MQTQFIKYINKALLLSAMCLVAFVTLFTSCEDDDDKVSSEIVLESFGPMPIARGAELSFIGYNLDQVTSVVLPSNLEISEFSMKSSELIVVTVPQNAVEGLVILKTPKGDITTKTPIGYSEPISIASLTPASIKAGQELTIAGDYLNLVKEIIFTDRITVADSAFISQSRKEIKVLIPAEAQTGKIAVSTGDEEPIIIYSETELAVTLPVFEAIAPNPVKAGGILTITGTDLDLVTKVLLGGDKTITELVSQTETKIELTVPADTQDGKVSLATASMVTVESEADLVLVIPTVTVEPTTIKNGQEITVTGTDLDLIDKVIFGGDKEGTKVEGGTATEMTVVVPDDALSGVVRFTTLSTKEVNGPSITIIDPVFTAYSPAEAQAGNEVTIDGTDLDLVVDVMFVGDVMGSISSQSETQIIVTVPVGAKPGLMSLITMNGTHITSPTEITINANLPEITSFSEETGVPGKILTINGSNLLLIKELIFPGGVAATAYGVKSDDVVEVYVPQTAAMGVGSITIITYEGEQGLSPEIFFGGTDPIVDPNLIINDYDEEGHDLSWDNWGGQVALGSDPALALSGNYMVGANSAINDWNWIWGCNHDALPKRTVTTADHVLKMDVNITTPLVGDYAFTMKMAGNDIEIGKLGIANADGSWSTPGWITITFDLADFGSLPAVIPASGDWGMTYWSSVPNDITGLYIDNIRFEAK